MMKIECREGVRIRMKLWRNEDRLGVRYDREIGEYWMIR